MAGPLKGDSTTISQDHNSDTLEVGYEDFGLCTKGFESLSELCTAPFGIESLPFAPRRARETAVEVRARVLLSISNKCINIGILGHVRLWERQSLADTIKLMCNLAKL